MKSIELKLPERLIEETARLASTLQLSSDDSSRERRRTATDPNSGFRPAAARLRPADGPIPGNRQSAARARPLLKLPASSTMRPIRAALVVLLGAEN